MNDEVSVARTAILGIIEDKPGPWQNLDVTDAVDALVEAVLQEERARVRELLAPQGETWMDEGEKYRQRVPAAYDAERVFDLMNGWMSGWAAACRSTILAASVVAAAQESKCECGHTKGAHLRTYNDAVAWCPPCYGEALSRATYEHEFKPTTEASASAGEQS